MRDKALNSARTSLTVVGLVLLVVFGVMAAGQARDMKLAGAVQHRFESTKTSMLGFLGFTKAADATVAEQQPTSNTASASASANAQPAQPTVSPSPHASDKAVEAVNKPKPSQAASNTTGQIKSTVNKTTNGVAKNTEKVTNNAQDDLNRIWP